MHKPFYLAKGEAHIGASVDIAEFPADGADTAMSRAKQAGRNAFRLFSAPDPEPRPAAPETTPA